MPQCAVDAQHSYDDDDCHYDYDYDHDCCAQWMSKLKEVGLDAADEPTVGHVLGDPVSATFPYMATAFLIWQ